MSQEFIDITDTQHTITFWMTKIGGESSIICSLYPIMKSLRDHIRRKKFYHRITVALSMNSVPSLKQFYVISNTKDVRRSRSCAFVHFHDPIFLLSASIRICILFCSEQFWWNMVPQVRTKSAYINICYPNNSYSNCISKWLHEPSWTTMWGEYLSTRMLPWWQVRKMCTWRRTYL